eukprot:TRINITY_DN7078_c0_g1_i1.p1 TRINITY_DN7078_c0_g1~~TRINITY_DN7078_c0_g1_i1.p1  ORF type:complete len:686 (-),score=234.71 TRINITY_DN7078_c0_g1_i1:69-2126(-)
MMRDYVKMVVIGDPKSGKTSMISSFLNDVWIEKVPKTFPETTIVADQFDSDYTMGVKIIDTPSEDDETIDKQIIDADGIILAYNSNCSIYVGDDEKEKKKRQREAIIKWLIRIRKIRGEKSKKCPIILAGTKIDERSSNLMEWENQDSHELEQNVNPILMEFPEVEVCIECSSKLVLNVQAVFNHCHKEIAYPISILYNSDTEVLNLTEKCKQRLWRIFNLLDEDRDGVLNNKELTYFQERCFGEKLIDEEITGIKNLLKKREREGETLLNENYFVTFDGFKYLVCRFIEKGKSEAAWRVLREFGYDDELNLSKSFLVPPFYEVERKKISRKGKSVVGQLSDNSTTFLKNLFEKYSVDNESQNENENENENEQRSEKLISLTQIQQIFEKFSEEKDENKVPFDVELIKNISTYDSNKKDHFLTLSAFLSLWHFLSSQNAYLAIQCLTYLGFSHSPQYLSLSFFEKSYKKDRNFFTCYLLGTSTASSKLLSIIDGNISKEKQPRNRLITEVDSETYLYLKDFGENSDIVKNSSEMEKCDMLCLMYDPESLSSIEWLEAKLQDTILPHLPEDLPLLLVSATSSSSGLSNDIQSKALSLCRKMNGTSDPLNVNLHNMDSLQQFKFKLFYNCKNYEKFLTTNNRKWKMLVVGGITSVLFLSAGSFLLYRYVFSKKDEKIKNEYRWNKKK